MRICLIVPTHWEARMGGAQYQARLLCEALLEKGIHEVFVLSRRVDRNSRPVGYRLMQITEAGWLRRRAFFFDALPLWKILRGIAPDVIWQRVGCAYTGIAAAYARFAGCRMIWHVAHDKDLEPLRPEWRPTWPLRYVDKLFLELGIRWAHGIVAQTHAQGAALERRYGRRADAVIYNFHPRPREAGRREGGPIQVAWVANLKPVKQPELFLQLAEDLAATTDARFVMVGKPAGEKPWNRAILERIERSRNVTYLGSLEQDEVNALLAESDIFVSTSRKEGFSNTFIQAWMRAVPVVSFAADPDGVLRERGLGACADGSYPKLRRELERLLSDRRTIRETGRRAADFASRHCGMGNVDRLVEIIEDRIQGACAESSI